MEVDVAVNLGSALATIAVMVALFVRVDKRIDGVDSKFESKVDAIARDLVDVKVSVARIEGHLDARSGYERAGDGRSVPEPAVDQPPGSYRQTG